jgi:hypothetical protein
VDADTTIADVAAQVNARQPRGRGDRFLTYGGKPLRASRSVRELGIQDQATLECSRRARGGCFSISILLWIVIFICCLISVCTCGLSLPVALFLLPFALLLPLCCL